MRVGFDFHNVLDAYPNQIVNLMQRHREHGDYVCVISAVGGPRRKGTIPEAVWALDPYVDGVFEVVFSHPSMYPSIKVEQALAIKLDLFYDDRQDVCDAMNEAGILCFKVPRLVKMSDVESDKED
jgi:hypothetical protein